MTPKKIAGGAARFSLIGSFFGWVSFRVYLFVADMRASSAAALGLDNRGAEV